MVYEYNGLLFGNKKRRNGVQINGITWTNLDNIIFSERSQIQKDMYCMIALI